jgi:hypothetical protein
MTKNLRSCHFSGTLSWDTPSLTLGALLSHFTLFSLNKLSCSIYISPCQWSSFFNFMRRTPEIWPSNLLFHSCKLHILSSFTQLVFWMSSLYANVTCYRYWSLRGREPNFKQLCDIIPSNVLLWGEDTGLVKEKGTEVFIEAIQILGR